MEEIRVQLDAFEGPLDLLLHLIEKNKIDIYDIPISEITAQYLEYIRDIPAEDMDRASEFLVMAATLIQIKSKMLLPPEYDEEGEEIDPRQELVLALLEYKMYRSISEDMRDLQEEGEKVFYKEPTIPDAVMKYTPKVNLDEICKDVTMDDLRSVFDRIMQQQLSRIDENRSKFGKIKKETVSLPEKMKNLTGFARKHRKFSFRRLMEDCTEKMDVIVTFVAVLEMIKQGNLVVTQETLFDDIQLESKLAA